MEKMRKFFGNIFLAISRFFKSYSSLEELLIDAQRKKVRKLAINPYLTVKEFLFSKHPKTFKGFIEITADSLPAVCAIECTDAFLVPLANDEAGSKEDEIFEDCKKSILETVRMFKKYLEQKGFEVETRDLKIL